MKNSLRACCVHACHHARNLSSSSNDGVTQGSILGPRFFLLDVNDLPDDVICDIAIYTEDTTLCSKDDQASDLWQ